MAQGFAWKVGSGATLILGRSGRSLSVPAAGNPRNLSMITYNNSVWNFDPIGAAAEARVGTRSSVSSWLDTMLEADGNTYRERGNFGFPNSWSTPPDASSTYNVNGNGAGIVFLGDAGWATIQSGVNDGGEGLDVVFTTDNFDMGVISPPALSPRPTQTGFNNTVGGESYVDAFAGFMTSIEANVTGAKRYWVFSGLPGFDEAAYGVFPGSVNLTAWKAHVRGDWTTWQQELVTGLQADDPTRTIGLLNSAEVFVDTWDNVAGISGLGVADWFDDLSPHGYAANHVVMAAICYSTIFQQAAPDISSDIQTERLALSTTMPIEIEQNWSAITSYINSQVNP